jgi:hypothetical protein
LPELSPMVVIKKPATIQARKMSANVFDFIIFDF